jgi:hypothetical protein
MSEVENTKSPDSPDQASTEPAYEHVIRKSATKDLQKETLEEFND